MGFKGLKKAVLLDIAKSNGIEASGKNTVVELIEILDSNIQEPVPGDVTQEKPNIPGKDKSRPKNEDRSPKRTIKHENGFEIISESAPGF